MSGQHRAPRPVGRGYMPKGGAAAARAQNDRWAAARAEATSRAALEAPTSEPVRVDERTDVRASARSAGRPVHWLASVSVPVRLLGLALVALAFVLFGLVGQAHAAVPETTHVDCAAFPDDPECVTPPPDPSPSPSPTATATSTPTPAPGVDTGVYLDPSTGSLRVDENTGVALGVACWLATVALGLGTAWAVLP